MADKERRSWGRLLARRVLLPGALLGGGAVGVGNAYVLSKTAGDIAPTLAAVPARPVAVVLGNTVFPGGFLSASLMARVKVSLDLYRAGKVQKIVVSGAFDPAAEYDEPGAMGAWLERRGVPAGAIVFDRNGHRTAATMANAAAKGFRDVIVCTQAFHLPRSLYLARHAGIQAAGLAGEDPGNLYDLVRSHVREWLARTETVVEVAVRGVTAQ
jgi:SanA protein